MATRTKTYKECDRAGCRSRTGVREYELVLRAKTVTADDPGYACVVATGHGELCPAHEQMTKRFIECVFKNTKEYPESELPEELT